MWMRRQGGGMVHGGGQGGGCWRYSTLYRLQTSERERITEHGRTPKEQTVSKAGWSEGWARWKGWRWRI
ncbi:hypothetical protein C369_03250 [Cryptococcus neoformans A5-35-17]|nr:hypothetical protein C369_03250 [Cryptococcus neoformans var. grubii A5-35-17]